MYRYRKAGNEANEYRIELCSQTLATPWNILNLLVRGVCMKITRCASTLMDAHRKFPCTSAFICKYNLFAIKNQEDSLGCRLERQIADFPKGGI